jgi:hypothetical protein
LLRARTHPERLPCPRRREPRDGIGYKFNTLLVQKERVRWDDKVEALRYRIRSTTNAEAAEELAAERSGKKRKPR